MAAQRWAVPTCTILLYVIVMEMALPSECWPAPLDKLSVKISGGVTRLLLIVGKIKIYVGLPTVGKIVGRVAPS